MAPIVDARFGFTFRSLSEAEAESFVALGLSVLVVDRWWDHFGDAVVAEAEVPALVFGGSVGVRVGFDQPVMSGTDQGGVVETCRAVLGPGSDVVGVAVTRFAVAAGEHTSSVPEGDRLA
jgi:hypothetical protein